MSLYHVTLIIIYSSVGSDILYELLFSCLVSKSTMRDHLCKDWCLHTKKIIITSTGSIFFLLFFRSLKWIEGRHNWKRKQMSHGRRRSLYFRRVGGRSKQCRLQWCRRCRPTRHRRRLTRIPLWDWMGDRGKRDAVFTPRYGCTIICQREKDINLPFQLLKGGFSWSPSSSQENSRQVSFHHHLRCCGDKHLICFRIKHLDEKRFEPLDAQPINK